MNYLVNASSFLIEALIGLALYAILLRFWMQWVRADFRNPIGHFLLSTTNPIVVPLRRVLPSIGSIDTATVVLAIFIAALKTTLLILLHGFTPPWLNILLYALVDVIRHSIHLFFAALIVSVIVSFVNPYSHHPLVNIAHAIINPLLAPFRRFIPPIAGLDITPVFLFILFQLALQFLTDICPSLSSCLL